MALVASSANAGVNLKNGNFYISYTDIVVPGTGKSLEMTRTYNSKSTEKGWFGFGWGNVFETKLIKSPDGCVVVHEHGAGGKTRFCPKNPVNPKKAAQKIVDAMRKRSTLTGVAEKNLMKRLTNNAELRHVYARKFGVKTNIAKGSVLYSNQRGIQEVHVTQDGYTRKSNDGKKEFFNKDGFLSKVKDKNNYSVEFTYKNKTLYSIKDSFAKQIYIKWNSNGRIKEMWSAKDKIASFKYATEKSSGFVDVAGNAYADTTWSAFLGLIPGSIGETSTLAILIGAVILLITGIGSWKIMLSGVVGAYVMGLLFNAWGANEFMQVPAVNHLVFGGFAFGIVFMATDPVSAAQTSTGKYIYGFLIGFLGIMIRVFNPAYPEGIMLAILFMNVMAPLIDHYVIQSNVKRRLKRTAAIAA